MTGVPVTAELIDESSMSIIESCLRDNYLVGVVGQHSKVMGHNIIHRVVECADSKLKLKTNLFDDKLSVEKGVIEIDMKDL